MFRLKLSHLQAFKIKNTHNRKAVCNYMFSLSSFTKCSVRLRDYGMLRLEEMKGKELIVLTAIDRIFWNGPKLVGNLIQPI